MDMIFLELCADVTRKRAPPYDRKLQAHDLRAGSVRHWSDLPLVHHLVKAHQDWSVSQLILATLLTLRIYSAFRASKLLTQTSCWQRQRRSSRSSEICALPAGDGSKQKWSPSGPTGRGPGLEMTVSRNPP